MISYFRSGPGECWRFRSDTRYATHTSDYGRRRWSSCGRLGPSSGTYTLPTSYQDILHLLWLWSSIMHRRLPPPSHLQLLLAFCFALCLVLPPPLPSFQPFLFLCSAVQCTSRPLRFLLFFPSILACVLPLSFIFLKTVHKRMRARIIFGWRIHRPNYAEKGSTNVRRPPFIDQSGRTLRSVANFQEMLCFVGDSTFHRISMVLVRPWSDERSRLAEI